MSYYSSYEFIIDWVSHIKRKTCHHYFLSPALRFSKPPLPQCSLNYGGRGLIKMFYIGLKHTLLFSAP